MTRITASGFIIVDRKSGIISGAGKTEAEAWEDVVSYASPFFNRDADEISDDEAFETLFYSRPATQGLIDHTNKEGGDVPASLVDGIWCTPAEAGEEA